MNEAIEEAEGMRNTFGAKVGLAGLDSYTYAAREYVPRAWKGVSP